MKNLIKVFVTLAVIFTVLSTYFHKSKDQSKKQKYPI